MKQTTKPLNTQQYSAQLANVEDGLRKFIRMAPLNVTQKGVRNEEDLKEALSVVEQSVIYTKRVLGSKLYRKQPFNVAEDVKRELEEWLLVGRNEQETALLRHRNLTMYHLVVEPFIDVLKYISHQESLDTISELIQTMVVKIDNNDYEGHFDDAIVAKAQVAALIQQRVEARKASLRKRKRKEKETSEEPAVEELVF